MPVTISALSISSLLLFHQHSKHFLFNLTADQWMLPSALNPSASGMWTFPRFLFVVYIRIPYYNVLSLWTFSTAGHIPHPVANICSSMFLSSGNQLGPQIAIETLPYVFIVQIFSRFLFCCICSFASILCIQFTVSVSCTFFLITLGCLFAFSMTLYLVANCLHLFLHSKSKPLKCRLFIYVPEFFF